jgi:hypothetical protein
MPNELAVRLVVISLYGRVLYRPVYPLDLSVGPGMIGLLGQSMFDPVFPKPSDCEFRGAVDRDEEMELAFA